MIYINGVPFFGELHIDGLVNVDQVFNSESENPQSGKAVAVVIQGVEQSLDMITDKMELVSFTPENIFNKEEYTLGYVTMDGTLNSSPSMYYSPKIPVKEGDVFRVYRRRDGDTLDSGTTARFITAYDKDLNVLYSAGTQNVNIYTVPNGVAYIVISIATTYTIEITKNCIPTEYTPYKEPEQYYKAKPEFVGKAVEEAMSTVVGVKDIYITEV